MKAPGTASHLCDGRDEIGCRASGRATTINGISKKDGQGGLGIRKIDLARCAERGNEGHCLCEEEGRRG